MSIKIKMLEREQQNKPKCYRRKEIIKMRAEMTEIEHKCISRSTNKAKIGIFKRIKNVKLLTILVKTNIQKGTEKYQGF